MKSSIQQEHSQDFSRGTYNFQDILFKISPPLPYKTPAWEAILKRDSQEDLLVIKIGNFFYVQFSLLDTISKTIRVKIILLDSSKTT